MLLQGKAIVRGLTSGETQENPLSAEKIQRDVGKGDPEFFSQTCRRKSGSRLTGDVQLQI